MTETKIPGLQTPAPGTDTNESTLPTATDVVGATPRRAASSGRTAPARVPSAKKELPSFSSGREKPG